MLLLDWYFSIFKQVSAVDLSLESALLHAQCLVPTMFYINNKKLNNVDISVPTFIELNVIVPFTSILSLQLQQDKELNEIVLLILQYIPSLTITLLNGIVPVILSTAVTTKQGIKRDSTVDSPV